MLEFIQSPIYDTWLKQNKPQKSLLICSPYIKEAAFNTILSDYKIEENIENLDFKMLIRGNPDEFSYKGSSDFKVLNKIIDLWGKDTENIRRATNLHMKAYLIDEKKLLITSGNLTNSGIFKRNDTENFEGGIATDDKGIIQKFLEYFNFIWKQGEPLSVFYDSIIKEYNGFIKDNSNKKVPKKKKKYQFPKTTPVSSEKFYLSDIPSANIEKLKVTLEQLKNAEDRIPRIKLGKILRTIEKCDNLDSNQDNQKYGEEKGNLAVYLGLAQIYKGEREYEYFINSMGLNYLNFSQYERKKYLVEQIYTKKVLCDILEKQKSEDFNLDEYLLTYCMKDDKNNAKKSTLDRRKKPIKKLLSLIDDTSKSYEQYL